MLAVFTTLAGSAAIGMVALWLGQRRLIYRPDTARVSPASAGLQGVTEIELPVGEGETVLLWHAPAQADRPTVLYFHGNAAGLADRSERIGILQAAGYGVTMMAYRGYAGSTGRPSERANVADAEAAYRWLRARGVAETRIVLFGESLGTGVAVQIAAGNPVAGVILDSPFTSLVDVVVDLMPLPLVRSLIRDRYVSIDHIARIGAPLLIVHGERDRIVPFELGKRLFDAAVEPKQFAGFPGVGHLVPFDGRGWPVIAKFLERLAL